ncbi:hypothetical protein PF66_02882 [Pseudomonas asplenii]|uniref:Uncharacterized protein n=1 Tax=Pseudomonas asplenii TaxID=53407 RepID=A0A0N0E438_9PSED|nr:hypothetical protein [Pseudomonas fuscovaginae]KPA90813.1 hypothetical protein PF66_02882 [Pseudomonas fuscovaginae]
MNSIFPVLPVIEPVTGEGLEWPGRIDPDREPLDEEAIPEGVALLLAVLEPRLARRPGALSMAAAGQPADLGDRSAEGVGIRKVAEMAVLPSGAGLGDEGVPGGEREVVRIEGAPRDGLAAPVQGVAVEERPVKAAEEHLAAAEIAQEEAVLRVAAELSQGVAQVRPETPVPLAQAFFEGAADERTAMSGQHEDAAPESREQDDEASGDLLQVPFHNERAQGQVLVSRDETGEAGLLIRATDRRVFEQLRGHFEQAGQPGWRLGGVAENDQARSA